MGPIGEDDVRNKILSNIFVGLGYLFIYKLLICTLALKFSCILTGIVGVALLLVLSYFAGEDIQNDFWVS